MKNSKRILSVTIKRMVDESPDTSWLGEYASSPTSELSIDRTHSKDCPVNAGKDELLWYFSGSGRIELQMTWEQAQSVSHSGQCDEDVEELSKVPEIKAQLDKLDSALLSSELKEYGAWDETECANHNQNLQRILWLAGGDITDNDGCQCDKRGDMDRNEYRYFNPSTNYVDENGKIIQNAGGGDTLTIEEVRKYVRQDYDRMESLNRGDWCFIGIRAEAQVQTGSDIVQEITSGGLWGIESDSDHSHLEETEKEELANLRDELKVLGFSSRAISTAFKNVERKDV